jgi:hypothetical protein
VVRLAGARSGGRGCLREDEGGAVYVEFLLAFIPLFTLFLGMTQMALLYTGNIVVRHAASMAARSAVVVLPDHPARYDGEPVNTFGAGTGEASTADAASQLLDWAGLSGGDAPAAGTSTGGARWTAIRSAASIPLIAISPSMEQLVSDASVYRAIGGDPQDRAATGSLFYNRTALAVTFPTAPGAETLHPPGYTFGPDEEVTVRVTYLFHCGVPIASQLLCNSYGELLSGVPLDLEERRALASARGADASELASMDERIEHQSERLQQAQAGLSELEYVEVPWMGYLMEDTGARFRVLRAEATLRNQGADYEYTDDGGDEVASGDDGVWL